MRDRHRKRTHCLGAGLFAACALAVAATAAAQPDGAAPTSEDPQRPARPSGRGDLEAVRKLIQAIEREREAARAHEPAPPPAPAPAAAEAPAPRPAEPAPSAAVKPLQHPTQAAARPGPRRPRPPVAAATGPPTPTSASVPAAAVVAAPPEVLPPTAAAPPLPEQPSPWWRTTPGLAGGGLIALVAISLLAWLVRRIYWSATLTGLRAYAAADLGDVVAPTFEGGGEPPAISLHLRRSEPAAQLAFVDP